MVAEQVEPAPLYHSPLGLFGFQVDGAAHTYWQWTEGTTGPRAILSLWDTGIGKAMAVSEPVLTPSGWAQMGDISVGDEVYSADGHPARVLAVHPQVSRESYRVTFSDGSWTRCNPEHLWTVSSWGSSRASGKQVREMRPETLTLASLMDRGIKTPNGRRKFSIPMTAPVQYPEQDLPLDPYLLGVLLGDAYIREDGRVWLTTDKEIIESVRAEGDQGSIHIRKGPDTPMLATGVWREELVSLGVAGCRSSEKFVPEQYLRSSEVQRRALLAGLLDTDGSPIDAGGVEFTSTSETLIDAVGELAESLGGQGRKAGSRVTTYTMPSGEVRAGQPSWRINVKVPSQPFRLARKAIRWTPPTKYPVARWIESAERVEDEDQVCITIDRSDGLYLARHHIVTHNSHLAMSTGAMLFEDDLVDKVIVVAEANKVMDWSEDDFPTFTDLAVRRYTGDPKRREKILGGDDQVLVMSYETGRNDICTFKPKSHAVTGSKMLTDALDGQRVAIVFDEFSRLRSRSTNLYVAWDYLLNRRLRKSAHEPYVLGLTATTVEKWPIDHWNSGRMIAPELAGTVAAFEENYIATRDMHNNPVAFKNLTPRESAPGIVPLNRMFESITLRKRKTDDDVIDHFPAKMENSPTMVDLKPQHRALYDQVEEIFRDETLPEEVSRQGFNLMRQISGHPASLLRSKGQYARDIVAATGPAFLESLEVAKVEAMLEWQARMAEQQTVIFTFFGGSILPSLEHALRVADFRVSVNHGSLSIEERKRQQDAFKSGDTQIFLSSDAGAKGLNLGVGTGLLHYENPPLWSTFDQRSNRIHRIDSRHPSVTIDSLIVRDSVEVGCTNLMLKRNQWAEAIQDPDLVDDLDSSERFLRARDRLSMLSRARG